MNYIFKLKTAQATEPQDMCTDAYGVVHCCAHPNSCLTHSMDFRALSFLSSPLNKGKCHSWQTQMLWSF